MTTREDDVDRIVAAWAAERPDADTSTLEVLSRIDRLSRLLEGARADAFAEAGVAAWEFDVLAALRRAGAPFELAVGTLLAENLVTSGTMTNRIDRLAARRLVSRRPDPNDRRGVLVRLSPAGRRSVDGALDLLLAREAELLSALSGTERHRLAGSLRRLLLALEGERSSSGTASPAKG